MKKIESIWHHLLWLGVEKKQFQITQQELARDFHYSLSTVNLAVKQAAESGAVTVSGKGVVVSDFKKLLYFWATRRNLSKDVIYQTYVPEPVEEVEGLLPGEAVIGGFTAAREILGEPPADYAKVLIYYQPDKIETVRQRFLENKSQLSNLIVLKSSQELIRYGQQTTIIQTFVDLWNMKEWYAHDFTQSLEVKINELLS